MKRSMTILVFCKMKIMINPKYEYLREYVERIPKDFETIGTVIHSGEI